MKAFSDNAPFPLNFIASTSSPQPGQI